MEWSELIRQFSRKNIVRNAEGLDIEDAIRGQVTGLTTRFLV